MIPEMAWEKMEQEKSFWRFKTKLPRIGLVLVETGHYPHLPLQAETLKYTGELLMNG
jgi:hypothetical protein